MKKSLIFLALVFGFISLIGATTYYTSMTAIHLYNSLIDNTPIGNTTPSNATFTTATATTFNGSLNGNATSATTAQALAATPSQCSGSTPLVSGIQANGNANCTTAGGSNIQLVTISSPCSTGSSSYDICQNFFSWPTAFPDTTYTIYCFGDSASNPRAQLLGITSGSKTVNGASVTTVTEGSVSVHYGSIYCAGISQ